MAAAYLTISAGTGRGNRTSLWSAVAVERCTGIRWMRAKQAIAALIAKSFLRVGEASTRTRPMYELQTFETVLAASRSLDKVQGLCALSKKPRGLSKYELPQAMSLVVGGLLWQHDGGGYFHEPPQVDARAALIWLPNTLVTGTGEGEPSPLKQLRQRRKIDALRLLVDLYHVQHLSADGGISRSVVREEYKRKLCGHCGNRFVWGFTRGRRRAYQGSAATAFFWQRERLLPKKKKSDTSRTGTWEAVRALLDLGLLSIVPHIVEDSHAQCEIIFACAWDGSGEEGERAIAAAATAAASQVLASDMLLSVPPTVDVLVPILDTLPDAQMVGIFRLHYRPHTVPTALWMRQLSEAASLWIEEFESLDVRRTSGMSASR